MLETFFMLTTAFKPTNAILDIIPITSCYGNVAYMYAVVGISIYNKVQYI